MKQIITILILIGLFYLGSQFNDYWKKVKAQNEQIDNRNKPVVQEPTVLPGMPENFEASYQAAQARGAVALKQWLDANRRFINDPRLASIELDYVVLIAPTNRGEARKVLAALGQRLRPNSPVYARFKKLEQSYLQ